jgi:hypothetical protein
MGRLEMLLEHRVPGKIGAIVTIGGVLMILGSALTDPTIVMQPVMAAILGGLGGAATGFLFQVGK